MQNKAELLARIKTHVNSRGLDIYNEVDYVDRYHSGFVPEESFFRLFPNILLNLPPNILSQLCESYKTERGVDIRRFADDVNNAQRLDTFRQTDTLSMLSELRKLKQELNTRNQSLRDIFRNYDPPNRGFVSENAFFKELGYSPYMEFIARKYTFDPTYGVAYMKLQEDLQNLPEYQTGARPDLSTLAKETDIRGIDLFKVLKSYDSLHTGRLSPDQFSAALRSVNGGRRDEAAAITNYYTDCDGLCNARKLCADLAQAQIEMRTRSIKVNTNKPLEKVDARPLIEEIIRTVRDRRLTPADYFFRVGTGIVTRQVFIGVLASMKIIFGEAESESLCDEFADVKSDGVDVQKFLRLFEVEHRPTEDVSQKVKKCLAVNGVRLAPLFTRFDLEKSGEVSVQQLIAVLTRAGVNISTSELHRLQMEFPGKVTNSVNYGNLCQAVDPPAPPPPKPIPQKPEAILKEEEAVEQWGNSRRQQFVRQITPEIINVLQKINGAFKCANAYPADELRDADVRRAGIISIEQMFSVFREVGVRLTREESNLIAGFYSDGRFVHYSNLVMDLDRKECQPQKVTVQEIPESLHIALKRLKAYMMVRSMTAIDAFEPYDSQSNRTVRVGRVLTAMSTCGYMPSEADLAAITSAFTDPRRPEYFNYAKLDDALRAEKLTAAEARRMLTRQDEEENRRAMRQNVLCEINQKADARCVRLRTLFDGCEPLISREEFSRRLDRLNIVIDPRDVAAICDMFASEGRVDWEAFCRETLQMKTIAPMLDQ